MKPIIIEFSVGAAMQLPKQLANETRNLAILSMVAPKSGRTYKRGGKTHTASAPGEAPAVDTGLMVQNIFAEKVADENAHRCGIPMIPRKVNASHKGGKRLTYPADLERGTHRVARRPWLEPAVKGAMKKHYKITQPLIISK